MGRRSTEDWRRPECQLEKAIVDELDFLLISGVPGAK